MVLLIREPKTFLKWFIRNNLDILKEQFILALNHVDQQNWTVNFTFSYWLRSIVCLVRTEQALIVNNHGEVMTHTGVFLFRVALDEYHDVAMLEIKESLVFALQVG